MTTPSSNNMVKMTIQQRRDALMELRRANPSLTVRQLAELLQCAIGTVAADVKALREELAEKNLETMEVFRDESVDRLETLWRDLYKDRDNPKTAAVLLNIEKQIAKLRGLETVHVDVTSKGEALPTVDVESILTALAAKAE